MRWKEFFGLSKRKLWTLLILYVVALLSVGLLVTLGQRTTTIYWMALIIHVVLNPLSLIVNPLKTDINLFIFAFVYVPVSLLYLHVVSCVIDLVFEKPKRKKSRR